MQMVSQGKNEAIGLAELYPELRDLAVRYLSRERRGHTLQPTALVHEVFLRLRGRLGDEQVDRSGLVPLAAKTMRLVLVDHARRRNARKRGGTRVRTPLDDALVCYEERALDVIALHDALDRIGSVDARMARIVELRFFAGLTEDKTASVMKVSGSTVRWEWRMAGNWLYHALREGDEVDAPVLDSGEENREGGARASDPEAIGVSDRRLRRGCRAARMR